MKTRLFTFCILCAALSACQQSTPAAADAPKNDTLDVRNPPGDSIKTPDVVDGPVTINYPDGNIKIKGHMRGGKRQGVWSCYFPDGKSQSFCDYEDGVLTGTSVVYHPNGTTYYTGSYHNGHEVGLWRFYDLKGVLLKSVTYDSTGTVINDR